MVLQEMCAILKDYVVSALSLNCYVNQY